MAAIIKGFGLRGVNITDLSQIKPLFEAYRAQDKAEVWNIHVSDLVVNPTMNRQVRRGHGKMQAGRSALRFTLIGEGAVLYRARPRT